MTEHPDFISVRKLALIMASGPFVLLALLAAIDFSWHQFTGWQMAEVPCAPMAALNIMVKPSGTNCQK